MVRTAKQMAEKNEMAEKNDFNFMVSLFLKVIMENRLPLGSTTLGRTKGWERFQGVGLFSVEQAKSRHLVEYPKPLGLFEWLET
jgi:hypothetical protein